MFLTISGLRGALSRNWKSHRTSKERVARSHKSQGCVRHTANRTWKANYNSVTPWSLQIPVLVRLFIPSPCMILVVCPLKSLVDSHFCELRNSDISAVSWSSEGVDENNLLQKAFYWEVPSLPYKTKSEETFSLVMFDKTEPSRSLRMKTFSQTRTSTPAKLVKWCHSSPPERKN